MVLWCICNYATLDGRGGLMTAGRWHSRGRPVVYCTATPSAALLEVLAHFELDAEDIPEHLQFLRIEMPDRISRERVGPSDLPAEWSSDQTVTQALGDKWIRSGRTLLLEVPSVLTPETWNVLANPLHREAKQLRITKIYKHPFDARLL